MYIKLNQQNIIIRISSSEADEFLHCDELSSQTRFTHGFSINYRLELTTAISQVTINNENNQIVLSINKSVFLNECNGRPSKKGLPIPLLNNPENLVVHLEIDLKRQ